MVNKFPSITIDEEEYLQVGCKKCQSGDNYKLFFNDKMGFASLCKCGHITKLKKVLVKTEPDRNAIPVRFIN